MVTNKNIERNAYSQSCFLCWKTGWNQIIFNNNWNENFYYDNDRFDKIMLNLISNAIKYSLDAGKIYINTYKTRF